MVDHPSTFALDVLALGEGPAEVQAHVSGCEQCQVQVRQLTAPAVLPPELRVRALERRSGRSRFGWLGGAFALAATAALVVVVFPPGPSLGLKGGPALELFVKRGETVRLWDSRSP